MSGFKTRKTHLINQDDEPPEKKLKSEGDLLIKRLHEKQICTKTSLSEQLSHSKRFIKSTDLIPVENVSAGSKTFEDICVLEKQTEEVSILKSAGISNDDIMLYLDYKKVGIESLDKKHKLLSKETIVDRIAAVQECLDNAGLRLETEIKHPIKEVNRHEKECLTVKPNSVETKLLKFVLENESSSKEVFQHPLDEIVAIEKDFMNNLNEQSNYPAVNKIRKKARNLANQIKKYGEPFALECPKIAFKGVNNFVEHSKWDVKESIEKPPIIKKDKKYTCKPQNYYTITDGKIVQLNKHSNSSESFVDNSVNDTKKRLTIDEIKEIPRFQNYEAGEVSKILYLKNLSNNTAEGDLRDLFAEFRLGILSIKVMQGKMKGQAFIEFSSFELAQKALDNLNGTIVKNKPMIIQFGKGRTNKETSQSDFG